MASKIITQEELNAKAIRLKELMQIEAEVKEEMEKIKDEFKAEMDLRGIDEIQCGMFTITYKEVISNKFDSARFKKENAGIYESYLKPSSSKRFLIK